MTIASDGFQAVQQVLSGKFDLVLMDIQMPIMDGYKAARAIRQFNKKIPIIALTAAALVEDREKALAAGMNDHLGKPFSSQQLYDHLKLWFEIQQKNLIDFSEGPSRTDETSSSYVKPISKSPMQRQSILIVDDQPANIKILANLLKSEYNIQVAKNGVKAIELSQGISPPDLILLDIMMPEVDGYRVCHELKNHQNTSNIPIIFITAMDEASNETHGFHLGAVDFISKPFHPEIVKARVRTHMNLKIKTDQLEKMSNIDGLTGIANRRYLDHALQNELSRLQRSGKPLGVVMLDIDYFKPFNDNYGHGKGDECLIQVAKVLQEVINRPADLLARYGGEEFVVLLPETDATGVNKISEDLRMAVNLINYPHEYSMVATHVTISVGCISKVISDETPECLLQLADNALYEAKRKGRNCVVCLDQCS